MTEQEMTFRLVIETTKADALRELGEESLGQAEETLAHEKDKMVVMTEQFSQVEKMLAMQKDAVKKAEVMSRLRRDDVDSLNEQRQSLLKAKAVIDNLMSKSEPFGVIDGPHLEQVVQLGRNIEQIDKSIDDALDSTNEWKKALGDLGLDKLASSAKNLMTVGGQVGQWAKLFGENTRQVSLWTDQNYQLYGSTQDVAKGVRNVQSQYGLLQKEAEGAMQAVASVSMAGDPAQINAITGAVGRFAMTTGASVEQSAKLVKQYQILGFSLKTAEKQFKALRVAAANYGITGKDMDVINQYMTKNMHSMAAAAGGSTERMAQLGKNVVTAGSMAKLAGMDMSEFGEIMQTLTDDATKFAVLLQGALTSSDPGAMFLTMGKNAGDAVDSLKGIESHWLKQKIANDTYGMSYDKLVKMDKAYENLEKATKGSKHSLEEMLSGEVDLTAAQEKAIETYRNEADAGRQFNIVMESLKNIFVDIIGPIVEFAAKIAAGIAWLMKFESVRWVITIIGILVTALVVLKWTISSLAIVGAVVPMFSGLTAALHGTAAASQAAAGAGGGMSSLGEKIVHFFDSMSSLDMTGVFKFAGAMLIFGFAMIILGWASQIVPPGRLQEMGLSLVLFAGAMWIAGQAMKQATKNIWLGVGAMLALGLGLVVLGFATLLIPPENLVLLALGILIIAGAMWVLGQSAAASVVASGALFVLALGIAALGLAMLIMPKDAFMNLLGIGIVILAMAAFVAAGALMLMFAAPIIAGGMTVLLAAMIIGALMLVPAIVFMIAALFIGIGIKAIMDGFGGDPSVIEALGKYAYAGLWGIAAGIDALVASSWFKFWLASEYIGEGLFYIMLGMMFAGPGAMQAMAGLATALPQLAAGITAFAVGKDAAAAFFEAACSVGAGIYWLNRGMLFSFFVIAFAPLVAAGLTKLGAGIRSFGSASGFVRAAVGFRSAIRIIGDGLMYYGLYVENAANRVLAAVFKVGMAQQVLKWMGLDEIIKSAATVTVKADVEDKKKESEDRLTQSELLEDILTSIQELAMAVGGLVTGGGATEKVEAVRELLVKYLPEIAEGDSQLSVGNTNQW